MAELLLVVYDTNIARMSLPGGQTYQWVIGRRRRVENAARRLVKVRSGELRASIHGEYEGGAPNHILVTVVADADHALWNHEGFGPKLMPPGRRMHLPPWRQHDEKFLQYRSGYGGNPFLRNALNIVMRDL